MKKVINGKVYNTETAKLIAQCRPDDSDTTTLYLTKKGQFFTTIKEALYDEEKNMRLITNEDALRFVKENDIYMLRIPILKK